MRQLWSPNNDLLTLCGPFIYLELSVNVLPPISAWVCYSSACVSSIKSKLAGEFSWYLVEQLVEGNLSYATFPFRVQDLCPKACFIRELPLCGAFVLQKVRFLSAIFFSYLLACRLFIVDLVWRSAGKCLHRELKACGWCGQQLVLLFSIWQKGSGQSLATGTAPPFPLSALMHFQHKPRLKRASLR